VAADPFLLRRALNRRKRDGEGQVRPNEAAAAKPVVRKPATARPASLKKAVMPTPASERAVRTPVRPPAPAVPVKSNEPEKQDAQTVLPKKPAIAAPRPAVPESTRAPVAAVPRPSERRAQRAEDYARKQEARKAEGRHKESSRQTSAPQPTAASAERKAPASVDKPQPSASKPSTQRTVIKRPAPPAASVAPAPAAAGRSPAESRKPASSESQGLARIKRHDIDALRDGPLAGYVEQVLDAVASKDAQRLSGAITELLLTRELVLDLTAAAARTWKNTERHNAPGQVLLRKLLETAAADRPAGELRDDVHALVRSLQREQDDSSGLLRQVSILKHQVKRLGGQLADAEAQNDNYRRQIHALQNNAALPVRGATRTGLAADDPDRERKRELLKDIFQQNIEMRKRLQQRRRMAA
jgi:hypothetical protein